MRGLLEGHGVIVHPIQGLDERPAGALLPFGRAVRAQEPSRDVHRLSVLLLHIVGLGEEYPRLLFPWAGAPFPSELEHALRLVGTVDGGEDEREIEGRVGGKSKGFARIPRGEVDGGEGRVGAPGELSLQLLDGHAPDLPRPAPRGQQGEGEERKENLNSQEL